MKRIFVFLIMIGFAAALSAQSLVGLARIEKARRLSLGGRRGPVVTNADLLRVKIRPAVEVIVPEEEIPAVLEEGSEAGEAAAAEAVAPETKITALPAGQSAAVPAPAASEAEAVEAGPTPEEKLKETEDLIDLLNTKIAALNQDYRFQTNMVPNYVIEQQLTETLKRLQNAQADAVRLRREIDLKRLEKRTSSAPIR